MELRDYLRVIRRRWAMILFSTTVVVSAAAILTFTATPEYSSSTRLFVSTSQSDADSAYQGSLFSEQRVTSYANLVTSRELAQAVINDLGLDTSATDLASQVSAEVVPETVIFEVTVLDPSPTMAQTLSQGFAVALTDTVRELETPPGQANPPIKVTIVDDASLPAAPVTPQPVRNLGLGLLLGLLIGVALAIARELLDNSIKSPEDFLAVTNAPLLGAIAYDGSARSRPLVTTLDSHAPRVESFRVLRTNLQFVDVDVPDKIFVVTSALPGEGKTSTSVNLAITLAQAGRRTLLIEGDLRRPKASAALGLDEAVGVTTVLLGRVTAGDAIQKHDASDLHVLGSGAIPPNPAELLQSNAMRELLAELRRQYDVIIIDAPPLLPVTDAALLAAQSDGALLVVRHGKTTKDQVGQSVDRLAQVDARRVGVVLNMVPANRRQDGYGYGYGYAPVSTPSANVKGKH